MKFLKIALIMIVLSSCNYYASAQEKNSKYHPIQLPALNAVRIEDAFWSPKLKLWSTVTVNDVFDKFEGKYDPDRKPLIDEKQRRGRTRNAFLNFDLVAAGKKGIGQHDGPEWYDGLIYETIRGAADLLVQFPDPLLEKRIDGFIERIAAAQAADSTGYLLTHTILMEPNHRWGFNGGMLRGQHDVYNAGMLAEAAVHYFHATGKVKLLEVATKLANYMVDEMGPWPKKNVVPAHSGPEEAFIELYWLLKNNPEVKAKLPFPVDEQKYYSLVQWWIENRGNHCGLPDWDNWDYKRSDRWVRDAKYQDPIFGNHSRPSWGAYSQDHKSVFKQTTIEGHAVRATLLGTGIATAALENREERYIAAADNLWNNMAGKRMFITGGVGAIAQDEKFGPDYYLPETAYLETCAAVGAGFFSQRMNQLKADGKYVDELERALYNNILSGISQAGNHYFYENPLTGVNHKRWVWHECPCCPPMFLKMVGALPQYIYAYDAESVYVNLFIGSTMDLQFKNINLDLKQTTGYPNNGKSTLLVNPALPTEFALKVRIPGWAMGSENPFDLYRSSVLSSPKLKVNEKLVKLEIKDGYAVITRTWKKGDKVEVEIPVQPRVIYPHAAIEALKGKIAIASGPLVYCLEQVDNANLDQLKITEKTLKLQQSYDATVFGGTKIVKGVSGTGNTKAAGAVFTAIPFYLLGNRVPGSTYKVWLPELQQAAK